MPTLIGKLLNKTPISYVARGVTPLFPWAQRNDAEAQMRAMGSVGTLFAIVHRTSNAASQVEWRLWRKAKSGKAEDRTEVTSHLALDIWNKPNDYMTRQEFVEAVQQHVDLTGEGWGVIARNPRMRSIPLELWPVRPDRMAPVPHPQDFIQGYVYTSPDGERVPLEVDSVVMLRMPNPLDPYRGMGPVQSILVDLDSTRYSAEWNRNFFLNSAEPGGVIEVDKRLSDDEWQEMTTRWREQHQGVANAHRVAVIEQGKWVNRTFTMRDMQFAELRTVSRDVIREAFGIPKFAVGDVDDVNRASAEASSAWFAEHLTVPRLERWKGMLNNDFLPLFGATAKGLEFDYEDPVPASSEASNAERDSRVSAAVALVGAGFTAESVVEAYELPSTLVWEKPEPPPQPPIQAEATVGQAQRALPAAGPDAGETVASLARALLATVEAAGREDGKGPHVSAGGSFLQLVGRFRERQQQIEAHLPGKHDQATHGRGGGIRRSLKDAKTADEVATVLADEAKKITGRDLKTDFSGSDVQIAREHADGILRGLERFPNATLTEVSTYGPGSRRSPSSERADREAPNSFAVTDHDGAPPFPLPNGWTTTGSSIVFNNARTADARAYRADLQRMKDTGWSVAGAPRGAALHEFGHVMAQAGRPSYPEYEVAEHIKSRAAEAGDPPSYYAAEHVSSYGASSSGELSGEIFADVMVNGKRASSVSRSAFSIMEEQHQGFVREVIQKS